MRWLIKADNPTDIKVNPYQRLVLNKLYYELVCQFDNLNLPLIKKKIAIAIRVIDFVLEADKMQSPERLRNASIIMRGLLATDDPDISWLYDVDIAETREQKFILTDLAVRILQYNKTKQTEKGKEHTSLEAKTSRLSTILGFFIDINKTSVLQYIALQDEANEKIKIHNQQWQKANA